jgi:hypothetical protein
VKPGIALLSQQRADAVFIWPLVIAIEDDVARFTAGADEEFHHSLLMSSPCLRVSDKNENGWSAGKARFRCPTILIESTNTKIAKNRSGTSSKDDYMWPPLPYRDKDYVSKTE